MTSPIQVDLPHRLGAEEAKRRIDEGTGRLKDFIPGGAEVRSAWTGDRLGLQVSAMGQEVNAQIDVRDTFVRVELLLPPGLAFFERAIEAALRRKGTDLLEDRSGEPGP
ncbi:polyhydroxyalkanoic acid system family protein [Sphingosinicella sp. CPCC 101087]|uniref:polyhydroxyalkanoic acid system family protein n=1 Tax=Sphingosinicella sp. CPCC 101087 TaxID=2497754 RepID=UPI00101C702C|nr:polyhydroxyalkanoic acid system family protein [Sphingosinicella sp. CPCC 101087]